MSCWTPLNNFVLAEAARSPLSRPLITLIPVNFTSFSGPSCLNGSEGKDTGAAGGSNAALHRVLLVIKVLSRNAANSWKTQILAPRKCQSHVSARLRGNSILQPLVMSIRSSIIVCRPGNSQATPRERKKPKNLRGLRRCDLRKGQKR